MGHVGGRRARQAASYLPRYAGVAERAGMASAFKPSRDLEVVERVPGSSSTDFWGVAHVPSEIEREVLSAKDLERRLDLLQASWAYFDDVAASRLRGARPGPARRRAISRRDHPPRLRLRAPQLLAQGRRFARRTASGSRRPSSRRIGRSSSRPSAPTTPRASRRGAMPIQFLIRRTAQHVMDHAWEMEDRDLTPAAPIGG